LLLQELERTALREIEKVDANISKRIRENGTDREGKKKGRRI